MGEPGRLFGAGLSVPALPCGEHAAFGFDRRAEFEEADGFGHFIEDRFKAAAPEIGFMPEAYAGGLADEIAPPLFVRESAGPGFERIEVAPVLPHADVEWEERIIDGLVQEQAVGFGGDGVLYGGSEFAEREEASERMDARMPR